MSIRARRFAGWLAGFAAAAVFTTFWAAPAGAQSTTPADGDLVGTWRGPFITDGPSGTMNLVITLENGALKVVNDMEGEGVPPKSDVREWKREGARFSFAQTFGEYDVFFTAALEDATIKGTLEAYQAGSMVGSGSFTLTRQ